MTVQIARRLFTVDEYCLMLEAGILHEDDRVELLEGEIVEMAPVGSRHAGTVKRFVSLLYRRIAAEQATISVQDPIRLSETSEPQPDIALLRPRDDFYAASHPTSEDIFLIIEVADTSAEADRELKLPLYAQAGIAEVWIVDLNSDTVGVYQAPASGRYVERRSIARGESVSPGAFPAVLLTVDEILG